jgi:PHD/YefM family antitoxin component YafN of YafNO toxin-antitoxin module
MYKNFFKILDEIGRLGVVEITRNNNKTGCYVLSKEEYEGMVETMEIMRDRELYEKILKSRADPDVTKYNSLEDAMEKLGLGDEV